VTESLKRGRSEDQLAMEQRNLEIESLRKQLEQSETTRVRHPYYINIIIIAFDIIIISLVLGHQ